MDMIKWFAIKFVMVFAIMWIALGLLNMAFISIFYASLLYTGISYIADRLLLPRYGNLTATAIDAVLAFVVVLFFSPFFIGGAVMAALTAFLVAVFIAIGEAIFHRYYAKAFFNDEVKETDAEFMPLDEGLLKTEFGSEIEIDKEEIEEAEEVAPKHHQQKKKNYVPHRKRNRHKKNPY